MKISEHAIRAAIKLDALAMATADTNDSCAPIIQAAIDAATKEQDREIERLKKILERKCVDETFARAIARRKNR